MAKISYCFAISALLLVVLSGAASAQEPIKLNLQSVAELATQRNFEVKIAQQDVEGAKEKLQEARAYGKGMAGINATYYHLDSAITTKTPPMPLPEGLAQLLGALAAKNDIPLPPGAGSIVIPPLKIAPQDPIHLTLQGGYPLYTSGKLAFAREQAEYGVDAYEQIAADTLDGAVYDSVNIYLGALLAREALAVNREAMESYNQHLHRAEVSYRSGVVADYDVIRAKTAVKEQESKLAAAQSTYNLMLEALRYTLALEDSAEIELVGSLFDMPALVDAKTLEQNAVSGNKLIMALESKSKALLSAEKFEKASGKPQVTAIASAELLTGNLANTDPKWLVGVQANMDIFDGGVKESKMAQKRSERAKTEMQLQNAKEQIRLAVRSALLEIDASLSSLESSKQARTLAEESLRLASRRFELGAGTGLEVLDATVSLSAAKVGELSALYQVDRAYLELHRYMGNISEVCREVHK